MRAADEADGGAAGRNFPLLFDPVVGVLGRVTEVAAGGGAPDFFHALAQTSDPGALGGTAGRFTATAAATDRSAAMAKAVRRAVARYCAALYDRDGLPLASVTDAGFRCVPPGDFALYSDAQYGKAGFPFVAFDDGTPVRWTGVLDLASSENLHMPAALVWFPYPWLRAGGDVPIAEPGATGLACAEGVSAATLAGLYDVIARDAAALFWQTATPPPRIRVETLLESTRGLLARFAAAGAGVAILDVTTNNRVPSFVAVATSEEPERPAYAFAVAADLDPEAAIDGALINLAETRRLASAAMRQRPPPSPAYDWEDVTDWADHLTFAAVHANRRACDFALSSEDRRDIADYDRAATGEADAELETVLARVLATGCRAYAANLTSEDIGALGLSVVRVVVPGYQPLLAGHRARALGGNRLYDVPQKLGYRGIFRGSTGNSAPHPFGGEK
jgi:ribosomal protein S12 methylthiotransferase accessory factor